MRTSRFFSTVLTIGLILTPISAYAFLDFDSLIEDIEQIEQDSPAGALGDILKELEEVSEGAPAVTFTDVPSTAWFASYVNWAATAGIVGGYKNPDGTPKGLYGPGDLLTVSQAMKVALLAAGVSEASCTGPARAAVGHWAEPYFKCAADRSMTLAATNPENPIKRGQVLRLFFEAFGVDIPAATSSRFTDVPLSHGEVGPVELAASLGIVSGDTNADGTPKGTYRPDVTLNRAEIAKLAQMFDQQYGD